MRDAARFNGSVAEDAATAPRQREAAAEALEMEVVISRVLQLGVVLAAAIIALGVAMWALRGTTGYPAGQYPTAIGAILRGLAEGRPAAVIQAGLVVLLLTPVFRVAASVLLFARQGDRTFVILTLTVLGLLVAGFLMGRGE